MVNSLHNQLPFDPKAVNKKPLPPRNNTDGKELTKSTTAMDTVTLTKSTTPHQVYTPTVSSEEVVEKGYEMLRKLVTTMLKEQGIDYTIATGSSTIDMSNISQEEAQGLIADDGYFGIEQTSDRIVHFAIAAAGGDTSKLDAIKEGVRTGFSEALEVFGGWLPDISYDTIDAVMEKLDAWADEADSEKAKIIG